MSNPYNAPTADLSQERTSDETYEPLIWSIHGRIGRLRYMAYGLLLIVSAIVFMAVLAAVLSVFGMAVVAVGMVLGYIAMLAVGFVIAKRRLNDMNLTGWYSLLQLLPVAVTLIWLRSPVVQQLAPLAGLVFWAVLIFWPGSKHENDYGLPPCRNSTGVVIGAMIFPALFVIGILAAVSLPAYQKYINQATQIRNPPAPALPDASQ